MSDNCIDEDTMNYYYNFVAIWNGLPTAQGDYVTSIGDIAHVIANVCDCNFRQPLIDISNQCRPKKFYAEDDQATEKQKTQIEYEDFKCGAKTLSRNLIEGAFITAGTFSDLL